MLLVYSTYKLSNKKLQFSINKIQQTTTSYTRVYTVADAFNISIRHKTELSKTILVWKKYRKYNDAGLLLERHEMFYQYCIYLLL